MFTTFNNSFDDRNQAFAGKETTKTRPNTTMTTTSLSMDLFDGDNGRNGLTASAVMSNSSSGKEAENAAASARLTNSYGGNPMAMQKSITSMISFNSSSEETAESSRTNELLGNKADVVYSLLTMLSSHDRSQSSQMLLNISQDQENCRLIRQSGCMTLLIQLLHPGDVLSLPPPSSEEFEVIKCASEALKNVVRYDADEIRQRRDAVVFRLLETVRNYVLHLRLVQAATVTYQNKYCEQAYTAMATLMKLSYDEQHRRSTCALGGLYCLAEALILDQKIFGANFPAMNLNFRRFIGMTLTNLTFGASETKRALCSNSQFLQALNAQIGAPIEELRQVFAGVLRNLSWKTDASSKVALRDSGIVSALMQAAIEAEKETTLKSILSALWNLSAHCSENKARICAVPSALEFLVSTLSYKSPTRSTAIVESGGGILRNVSSHVALNEDYRSILRRHGCFQALLDHLQSSSLTIVSNACGTLWNLSAHNVTDQRTLWQMGAESKLRNLVHSKHRIISLGSAATLKNLLASRIVEKSTIVEGQGEKEKFSLLKNRHVRSAWDEESNENTLQVNNMDILQVTTSRAATVSPQRRQTAAHEVARMLNDVTQSVILKPTSPFRKPLPPSQHPRMVESASATSALDACASQKTATFSTSFTAPTSREERMQFDKAMVHRFHNSLRRNHDRPYQPHYPNSQMVPRSNFRHHPNMQNQNLQENYSCFDDPVAANNDEDYDDEGERRKTYTDEMYSHENFDDACPTMYAVNRQMPAPMTVSGPAQVAPRPPTSRKASVSTTPAEFKSEPSSRGSKSVPAVTPLMFSRQSSLQSLDSCDQHSVRSTVYSEHSQLPTGLHSPSELPDSPTNTVPQSPANFKVGRAEIGDTNATQTSPEVFANTTPISARTMPAITTTKNERVFISDIAEEEEKPRVYNLDSTPSKLSAASSLSALTIDTENRIGPIKKNAAEKDEKLIDDGHIELRECINAGRPSPKPNACKTSNFRPVHFGNEICKSKLFEEEKIADSGDNIDVRMLMQSAMPKPKALRTKNASNVRVVSPQHRGKNVAVAKPIVRNSTSSDIEFRKIDTDLSKFDQEKQQQQIRASASFSATPRIKKEEQRLPSGADDEEFRACIASALPKPKTPTNRKSKSLDRKTQRCNFSLATDRKRDPEPSEGTCMTNNHFLKHEISEKTDKDDSLLLSCSSAFMSSTATTERIKDASILFSQSDERKMCGIEPKNLHTHVQFQFPTAENTNFLQLPVARVAPEPQKSTLPIVEKRTPTEDTTNESLSEDNYSNILDESFNLDPDDIDLDSMVENEDSNTQLDPDDTLISPNELLIDCETLSSNTSRTSTMTQNDTEIKKIPPKIARKPIVRTTKATELRAKKAILQQQQQQAAAAKLLVARSPTLRSRSMSPAVTNQPPAPVLNQSPSPRKVDQQQLANERLRHHSAAGKSEEKNQLSPSKSPSSPRRTSTIERPRRRLGANVKDKIASLQVGNEKNAQKAKDGHKNSSGAEEGIQHQQETKRMLVTTV